MEQENTGMKLHIHKTAVVAALVIAAMGTQAATIANYGDFPATSVSYNQVSENTDIGMYQAPIIVEDTINFNPLDMVASSPAGGGAVTNNALLNFDVQANAGKYIQGLYLTENGIMTTVGSGSATYVDVTANFLVTISMVNGVSVPDITESFSMSFNPREDGTWEFGTDGPAIGKFWDGSIFLDFASMLGYPGSGGATLANVSLENVLIANADAASTASIQKQNTDGLSITADVIPEPASIVLLMGATSFLAFIRRRIIG